MTALHELLHSISAVDRLAVEESRKRWDSLAKPLGSLGLLEDAITKIAGLTGSSDVDLSRRTLLVFCADNGVVAQGVTQCGSEVTAAVAEALADGRSSVSPMARLTGCEVRPVDVGISTNLEHSGLCVRKIRNGTSDISLGPAMAREECLSAIHVGLSLVQNEAARGTRLLAIGEMGIGNTTTTAAVTAALLRLPPETVTGRGAGLSTEGLKRKQDVIRRALACNNPDPSDPVDVLSKVGGLDLAAMCGAFLGGALFRIPTLIDGAISAAAALCAVRLCHDASAALLASHLSREPAASLLLQELRLSPLISADMHLGEGCGAVCAMPLLDMALSVYNSGQDFSRLGIAAYEHLK